VFKAVRRAEAAGAQIPPAVARYVVPEQDLARCGGDNEDLQQQARAEAQRQAALDAAAERVEVAQLRPQLRSWPAERLCFVWGELVKGEPSAAAPASAVSVLRAEARRRGFAADAVAAKVQRVDVGMDACQVWAAWGYPERTNITGTGAGTASQWVYGLGRYVYTDAAGRVVGVQQ
jgi:hypothetical protein